MRVVAEQKESVLVEMLNYAATISSFADFEERFLKS